MARINNLTNFLTDVASAIKTKTGDSTAIPASQFDTKIANITTGVDTTDANAVANDIVTGKTAYVNNVKLTGTYTGIVPTGTKSITQNGTVDVSNYASANVNVPTPSPTLQSKSVTITENGTTTITADSGYDGLDEVEVTTNVSGGTPTSITKMSDMNTLLKSITDNFINYAENIQNNYEVLSNEPVTLYTPDINYKYYAIQRRSSGKYRVDWFDKPRKLDNINIYPFYSTYGLPNYSNKVLPVYIYYYLLQEEKDYVYVSPEYDSIETCIQKMKNNELTYTYMNNYLAYLSDGNPKIPIANVGIYYFVRGTSGPINDEFITPKKISSNETFVQI